MTTSAAPTADVRIDPRSPRIGAILPLALSVTVLILGAGVPALAVLALMAFAFLPGAIIGPQATVQAWVFRTAIRQRLAPPVETESFRPPRFAQQVGLACTLAALAFGLAGVTAGMVVFTGLVTAASFLNAAFNFCLGCELNLLFKRLTARTS